MFISIFIWLIMIYVGFCTAKNKELTCKTAKENCIDIRKCRYYVNLLKATSILRIRVVIRQIREHQCGFVKKGIPKVCCMLNSNKLHYIFLNNSQELTRHVNYNLFDSERCGGVPIQSFRVTYGDEAELGEFPWMALIAYNKGGVTDFKCGGTLINKRYILTAAHCILNRTIVGVRLGEHNLNEEIDCDRLKCAPPVQDFFIEKIILHPKFAPAGLVNDIALIRLAAAARISSGNVEPICLPFGHFQTETLDGKGLVVSGWGVTETGHKSDLLLKATVPVLSLEKCQTLYPTAKISNNQICAGGTAGKDSCAGDSGGPLKFLETLKDIRKYIQYGIVSYGPKHCGSNGLPGIYTKVSQYLKWILDNVSP